MLMIIYCIGFNLKTFQRLFLEFLISSLACYVYMNLNVFEDQCASW